LAIIAIILEIIQSCGYASLERWRVRSSMRVHVRGTAPLMMEMTMTGWIILGLLAALALYLFAAYNGLVAMNQRANQAFADIDVQLKQRHDLIPNLVETVKGYASHEKETFDAVVKARNAALSASGPQAQAAAEQGLSGALGRLLALSEAYPDLKASENFQQLQTELANVEDKLAAARRFFNNAVQEFNTAVASIPAVFFAAKFGFFAREFFDIGEETRGAMDAAPPSVKF
jgi:LemA protein